MIRIPILLNAVLLISFTTSLSAQTIPTGYTVPDLTLSPDKSLGVTVPKSDEDDNIKDPENQIIELKTGRILGIIKADEVVFDHINNGEIVPALWSADNSMLLWQVDRKWGFATEVLIQLENGKIKSQIDILSLLQQEILKRTNTVSPKKYAAVKATSGDYGSWYKDGFAIDCVQDATSGPLKFPLLYHVFLTSNTKGLEDVTNLDSRMTAKVNADGTIKVEDFHLGKTPAARTW